MANGHNYNITVSVSNEIYGYMDFEIHIDNAHAHTYIFEGRHSISIGIDCRRNDDDTTTTKKGEIFLISYTAFMASYDQYTHVCVCSQLHG